MTIVPSSEQQKTSIPRAFVVVRQKRELMESLFTVCCEEKHGDRMDVDFRFVKRFFVTPSSLLYCVCHTVQAIANRYIRHTNDTTPKNRFTA